MGGSGVDECGWGGDNWQADLIIVMHYTVSGISWLVEELVAS